MQGKKNQADSRYSKSTLVADYDENLYTKALEEKMNYDL